MAFYFIWKAEVLVNTRSEQTLAEANGGVVENAKVVIILTAQTKDYCTRNLTASSFHSIVFLPALETQFDLVKSSKSIEI